jgi:hypothetical protein
MVTFHHHFVKNQLYYLKTTPILGKLCENLFWDVYTQGITKAVFSPTGKFI